MKILLLIFLLVSATFLAAQSRLDIRAIDSLTNVMDAGQIQWKRIKVQSIDIDKVQWKFFQIDTVTSRFVKASVQQENSKNVVTYYFYNDELIKVRKHNLKGLGHSQDVYFNRKHIIQHLPKGTSLQNVSVYKKTASDLMNYVTYVRSRK